LSHRTGPPVVISDERAELLGTAGGVIKALPQLGDAPFFHVNSDTIWIDGVKPNLHRLADAFDAARMDALLLVAPTASSIGYTGRGDFSMAPDGALTRRGERDPDAGVRRRCGTRPVVDDAAVRPRRRGRAALRPAPRRRLDACRNPRCHQSRRGSDPGERRVTAKVTGRETQSRIAP
jgi:hypothetical protein